MTQPQQPNSFRPEKFFPGKEVTICVPMNHPLAAIYGAAVSRDDEDGVTKTATTAQNYVSIECTLMHCDIDEEGCVVSGTIAYKSGRRYLRTDHLPLRGTVISYLSEREDYVARPKAQATASVVN